MYGVHSINIVKCKHTITLYLSVCNQKASIYLSIYFVLFCSLTPSPSRCTLLCAKTLCNCVCLCRCHSLCFISILINSLSVVWHRVVAARQHVSYTQRDTHKWSASSTVIFIQDLLQPLAYYTYTYSMYSAHAISHASTYPIKCFDITLSPLRRICVFAILPFWLSKCLCMLPYCRCFVDFVEFANK